LKRFTKIIPFLCLSLFLIALTGCGNTTKTSEKVTIEYWHVNAESFGGATVKQLIETFNKENPDIEVVEKFNPDMYKGLTQNLQAAMASGKNPDVVQMGYSYLNYAGENLKYDDIQELINTQMPEDKNFIQDNFLPNIISLATTDDGKQIGVPYS